MKKAGIIIQVIFSLSISTAPSQNLVLNSSFEDYSVCPDNGSELDRCVAWKNPSIASPDYFNTCYIGPSPIPVDVPSNFFGYQLARNGFAYSGIWTATDIATNYREYIEGQLSDSLIQGKKYCLAFYVSLADSSYWAVDRIGAYLSVDSTHSILYTTMNYQPQIENPLGNFISDTVNWVKISGVYIASGGEKYITIGNFYDDANTMIDSLRPSNQLWGAYYYIDDVSVEEMQMDTANAGAAQTICSGDSVVLGTPQCNGCLYQWQNATGLNDTTIAQPTATPAQTTTYILLVTDTSTGTLCEWSSTDTVTVTVLPAPVYDVADAGAEKTICKGQEETLGVPPCGGCTYQWQPFGSLNNSTIAQPTATPTQTTTYLLTMTDSVPPCAKTTTDSVNVIVEDCSEQPIEIYDIFTPNGDAKNDVFYIKNLPANSSLQIFNRWGSKVYSSSNYANAWDGGKVPDGTYFYLLTLPTKETLRGFVEIRR